MDATIHLVDVADLQDITIMDKREWKRNVALKRSFVKDPINMHLSLSQHYTDNFLWIFKERKKHNYILSPPQKKFSSWKKVSPFFCPVKNVSTPFSGLLLFWNKSIMHSVKFLLQNGSFERTLRKASSLKYLLVAILNCLFVLKSNF